MDLGLSGRGALVTGGNRGIGKAVAAALVREGALVVLLARDRESLLDAVAEVGATGHVVADTTDDDEVRAAVKQAEALLGHLDVVVNCAAPRAVPGQQAGLAGVDDRGMLRDLDTKVLGYLRVARASVPYLRRRGGAIVNVSGMNARSTGSISGSVRNIGVVALTKNLADELGADGIAVTCVHPGMTLSGQVDDQEVMPLAADNALRRPVRAEELADLVAFLASPRGRLLNGAVVAADGGRVGPIWA